MVNSRSHYVLLDTDVWSAVFGHARSIAPELPGRWKSALTAKSALIATQTRAEIISGTRRLGERRAESILRSLETLDVVPVTEEIVQAYATLGHEAKQVGHPIHEKIHTGDRWIAATAIALGISLFSADRMFTGAPRLTLFSA